MTARTLNARAANSGAILNDVRSTESPCAALESVEKPMRARSPPGLTASSMGTSLDAFAAMRTASLVSRQAAAAPEGAAAVPTAAGSVIPVGGPSAAEALVVVDALDAGSSASACFFEPALIASA